MFSFPKIANFECHYGQTFPDKSVQTFGYNFEPKGNFTFSWDEAVCIEILTLRMSLIIDLIIFKKTNNRFSKAMKTFYAVPIISLSRNSQEDYNTSN